MKKIAVLTSKGSWFVPHARALTKTISHMGYSCKLFHHHAKISASYNIVFILSYFRLIGSEHLKLHEHNLVVHESDLPKGKGWAPYFWQILQGKNRIPVVLFEATQAMDAGNIYFKDCIRLEGHELNAELREKQALKSIELCLRFLRAGSAVCGKPQKGKSTLFPKRTPKDSELNINKSIKNQFNLLRIADNLEYPVFFRYKKAKYTLKIEKIADEP